MDRTPGGFCYNGSFELLLKPGRVLALLVELCLQDQHFFRSFIVLCSSRKCRDRCVTTSFEQQRFELAPGRSLGREFIRSLGRIGRQLFTQAAKFSTVSCTCVGALSILELTDPLLKPVVVLRSLGLAGSSHRGGLFCLFSFIGGDLGGLVCGRAQFSLALADVAPLRHLCLRLRCQRLSTFASTAGVRGVSCLSLRAQPSLGRFHGKGFNLSACRGGNRSCRVFSLTKCSSRFPRALLSLCRGARRLLQFCRRFIKELASEEVERSVV